MNKKSIETLLMIDIIILVIILFIAIIKIGEKSNECTKYEYNPILGNEDTGSLFDPHVIIDSDGIYRMYVSWRKKKAIAVTTSNDGINWTPLKIVLNRELSTGWEDEVNRATVIYKEGMYHMWYTGQANNISRIGYAISKDGYLFERRSEPVIYNEEQWENDSVMNPDVIYDEEENIFKMWYAAGETYEPDVIAYATSRDGVNWNKYNENPILKANENKRALDNFKVGGCDVHKISNNSYIMFYIGYTDIDTARIFIAKSQDGMKWERNGKAVISPQKDKFDSEACYKPTAIFDSKNNKWMIWYNGRTANKEYIGLATYNEI